MRELRRRVLAALTIGTVLACGRGVGAEAPGFTLYAPSGSQQRLLVVRVRPAGSAAGGDAALELVGTPPLGFPGRTITAHPTRPLLYVSGGPGPEGRNAAVVPLDAAGLPQEPRTVTLDRGYAYLAVDRAGRFLLGCDYGSGAVDVFPLDAAGLPGKRSGGAAEGRATAHCVIPSPDNRFVYVPYVKENNALYQYAFDAAAGSLAPLDPPDVGPPAGSGPRHFVYHPRLPLLYFSEEQGLGVSAYRRGGDGRLTLVGRSRAVPADVPAARMSSSDIEITPDGRHLYSGIRGPDDATNLIACYAVDAEGSLAPRGVVPTDRIPWGMTLSPDGRFLAVTGYESATLVLHRIAADGSLTRAATLPFDKNVADIVAR